MCSTLSTNVQAGLLVILYNPPLIALSDSMETVIERELLLDMFCSLQRGFLCVVFEVSAS